MILIYRNGKLNSFFRLQLCFVTDRKKKQQKKTEVVNR